MKKTNEKKILHIKQLLARSLNTIVLLATFSKIQNNKGKSKADAIAAWNEIKAKPGSNAYVPQKVEN